MVSKSETGLVWGITVSLVLCVCGPLFNLYAQDENARRTGQDENANRSRKTINNPNRAPKPIPRRSVVRPTPQVVTASLSVTVTPADSSVWLNNERKEVDSTGGLVLKIPPASYTLIVRHEGFRDDQRSVDLKSGENPTLTINLAPLKGILNIRPSVDGTSIELRSLDRNQNVGSYAGAIDQIDFPPGEYEITISKPGYANATRTVTLKAGATVELEPRLDLLPPPKPAPKPRPRPMSARVETDGKYLIVHLSGTSADDSTALGTINVSVNKSSLAFPEVSGTLNGSPCLIEFFKIENIDEGSLMETPGPSNQYSVIVVRIRPKESKRPVRFAINWKSIGSASQSPQTVSTFDTSSEATPTHKVLPTLPTLARSSQTQGSVNVAVVIDEQGNVISAKAIDGPVVLRQAAENAARQWKFRPATRNGIAIQTTQTIRFNFEKVARPFSPNNGGLQMKISRHTLMIFTLFVALLSPSLVYGVDGPVLPIPSNLKLSVELLSPLSTATNKKGDKFSCKILTPAEYAGAIVEGHIRNLKRSGKANKDSNIDLAFEKVTLSDGRGADFSATVVEVFDVVNAGSGGRADNEGTVRNKSTTVKASVKRAAAGALIGAGIGVTTTLATKGPNLEFREGTQFTVVCNGPTRKKKEPTSTVSRTAENSSHPVADQPTPPDPPSSSYRTYTAKLFSVNVPDNWHDYASETFVAFAPERGYVLYQGQPC